MTPPKVFGGEPTSTTVDSWEYQLTPAVMVEIFHDGAWSIELRSSIGGSHVLSHVEETVERAVTEVEWLLRAAGRAALA